MLYKEFTCLIVKLLQVIIVKFWENGSDAKRIEVGNVFSYFIFNNSKNFKLANINFP